MQNQSLLVHQITGEDLINTIRSIVEGSIEKKLAPVISVLSKLKVANIEKKEAAELLGMSIATVNNYITSGKLSPVFVICSSHMKYKF